MGNYKSILTEKAKKDIEKLSAKEVSKIRGKINYFLSAKDPMVFAKPLVDLPPATHRFRFGKFRMKFFCQGNIFYITRIDFRGKIYRR
ncbi:hypothetical protein KAI56_01585 [Candidatus Parcubacteria bacterium]|nr:hypothetical protein [Candidatus Parcubacteria bacterium]